VSENANQLPTDIEVLQARLATAPAERDAAITERDQALSQNDRLWHLLRQLQRAHSHRCTLSDREDEVEVPTNAARNARTRAPVLALKAWLEQQLAAILSRLDGGWPTPRPCQTNSLPHPAGRTARTISRKTDTVHTKC
jgi:hypothetical protein